MFSFLIVFLLRNELPRILPHCAVPISILFLSLSLSTPVAVPLLGVSADAWRWEETYRNSSGELFQGPNLLGALCAVLLSLCLPVCLAAGEPQHPAQTLEHITLTCARTQGNIATARKHSSPTAQMERKTYEVLREYVIK